MLYYQMTRWWEGRWVSYNNDDDDDGGDDGDDGDDDDNGDVEQRGKQHTTLPASSHHTITVWDLERRKENDDGDDDFAKLEV